MSNFFNVLKQAQDLKGKVSELKYKLDNTNFVGKDDEGQVEVIVSGKGTLLDLNISPECLVDSSLLKNKIREAYNNAKVEADRFSKEEINKVTGGIPLPFDLKSFF